MTPEQHTILKTLGVQTNVHMKYTDAELADIAFKAGKKYPAIQGADYIARDAMLHADSEIELKEFMACMANIERWCPQQGELF